MADNLAAETFDASDAVAINNAKRDAERIVRDDADVLRSILHTKKGRAWLIRQLDRCYVNSPLKFVSGQPDTTAHNLGRESYGVVLLQEVLAASPDLYMKGITEQQEEARRQNEVRRTERKNQEAEQRGPSAQDQMSALPPPKGFPGHKPPATPPKPPKR